MILSNDSPGAVIAEYLLMEHMTEVARCQNWHVKILIILLMEDQRQNLD